MFYFCGGRILRRSVKLGLSRCTVQGKIDKERRKDKEKRKDKYRSAWTELGISLRFPAAQGELNQKKMQLVFK